MSYLLICDGDCSETVGDNGGLTREALLDLATERGWVLSGDRHYCQGCDEKRFGSVERDWDSEIKDREAVDDFSEGLVTDG